MYIGFTNIILLCAVLLLSPSILTLTHNQSNFYQALSDATLAQLVEQPPRKRQVVGSTPMGGSIHCLCLIYHQLIALRSCKLPTNQVLYRSINRLL